MHTESPIPVTVITGFLGSGKTTLINRILAARPAEKIAVIENEYGKAAIDHALFAREAEVVELNDGCICCSVRADLIHILGDFAQRIAAGTLKLDRVLIETTGLADPAPVVQTFFADPVIHAGFRLDALLTVVDAEHAMRQLDARAAAEMLARHAARFVARTAVGEADPQHAGLALARAMGAAEAAAERLAIVRQAGAEGRRALHRHIAQDDVDRAARPGREFGGAGLDDLDALDQLGRQPHRRAVAAGQRLAVDQDARLQAVDRTRAAARAVDGQADARQLPQDFADGGGVVFFQVFAADDDFSGGRVLTGFLGIRGRRDDLNRFQGRHGIGLDLRKGRAGQSKAGQSSQRAGGRFSLSDGFTFQFAIVAEPAKNRSTIFTREKKFLVSVLHPAFSALFPVRRAAGPG